MESYAFEPVQQDTAEEKPDDASDTKRLGNVSWCTCGSCWQMETKKESICCQEVAELNKNLDCKELFWITEFQHNQVLTSDLDIFTAEAINCITDDKVFSIVCKHQDVLWTGLVCMHDVQCDSLLETLENRY